MQSHIVKDFAELQPLCSMFVAVVFLFCVLSKVFLEFILITSCVFLKIIHIATLLCVYVFSHVSMYNFPVEKFRISFRLSLSLKCIGVTI